jgi:NAD+ kinase
MMDSHFKVIGIIGRVGRVRNLGVKETLSILIDFLKRLDIEILIESETVLLLDDLTLNSVARQDLGKHCDLLIVVGGDGSLLNAAHAAVDHDVPVLGINRGSLGFLTDINPCELNKIKTILEGDYMVEKRFLLSAGVDFHGQSLGTCNALNEAALIPDAVPHMNEFEVYINNQFVCSQHADGLIIATPTGSTAYALSGGGPILHPSLDAIVIVPMFPHTLSMRPIVISGDSEIAIHITTNNTTTPRLTCDGQGYIMTPPGCCIHIAKKSQHLNLIHPLDYDYYETIRSKLHWGHKLQRIE